MKRLLAILVMLLTALGPILPLTSPTHAQPLSISSRFATTPPRIDGFIDWGEWDLNNVLAFPHGVITFLNDRVRLYILIDVKGDTIDEPPTSAGDYFIAGFDVNHNGVIDPNVDLIYGLVPGQNEIRYSFFLGPGVVTGLQPSTRSSLGKGFSCFFADGTLSLGFFPFFFNCSAHKVWEMAIDLDEIGSQPGGIAKVGFRIHSSNPSFTDDLPANALNDVSQYTTVNLGPPPDTIPAVSPGSAITLEQNAVEVTQAIQTRDDSLPLVEKKTTVARVYADTVSPDPAVIFQPAKIYLYGTRNGIDLPGSPLATLQLAPTSVNRNTLSNTANFLLPPTWVSGSVTFTATARDLVGNQVSSTPITLGFTPKEIPTIWVIPLNTGTAASPVLPSNAAIAAQESFLSTTYPVRGVNFVQKSWTVIGPVTVAEPNSVLSTYWTSVQNAWVIGLIISCFLPPFICAPPFTLPDEIFGFTTAGGGNSDPTWCPQVGGTGRVARGGGSVDTMAHETNHNADKASGPDCTSGTWGRHVSGPTFGCGAAGPDPNWPTPPNNDNIREVGFDTRQPFNLLPANFPDIMSYCTSGQATTKWISGYRWQNLFNHFQTVASSGDPALAIAPSLVGSMYYVSGTVNSDGTGSLDPVFVQPGIPSPNQPSSSFAVQVLASNGTVLSTTSFTVGFTNLDGGTRTTVPFNLQIPVQPGAGSIRLVNIPTSTAAPIVLAQRIIDASPPTVSVTYPTGGAIVSDNQPVTWTASDPDNDPLTFKVFYSSNNGTSWMPLASGVKGSSLPVDWSTVAGGSQGKVRVVATDGVNTAQADSNGTFTVARKAPSVTINTLSNTIVHQGQSVTLTGDATDLQDGSLANDHIAWAFDGTLFATGRSVQVTLPPGRHNLTLEAVNSVGNLTTSTVVITVIPTAPVTVGGPITHINKLGLLFGIAMAMALSAGIFATVGFRWLRPRSRKAATQKTSAPQ